MCREACSSHTNDTRLLHDIADLILGQLRVITILSKPLDACVLLIILNYYTSCFGTIKKHSRFYCFDGSRNRTADICRNKATGFANLLSYQHLVALFHDRSRRRTNMLSHGKYILSRQIYLLDRQILRQLFSLVGMNTPTKCCVTHSGSPFFVLFCRVC